MDPILYKCGGPRYLTRDGRQAVVLESNAELIPGGWDHFFQGRVDGEPTKWNPDGTHRGGDPALDLVAEAPG